MHGGAKGSGAPQGNQNAFKHGKYSQETLAMRREATRSGREFRELLAFLKENGDCEINVHS